MVQVSEEEWARIQRAKKILDKVDLAWIERLASGYILLGESQMSLLRAVEGIKVLQSGAQ